MKTIAAESLYKIVELAEQGDSDSQFILGAFYDEGFGVDRNFRESVRWFRKAADQGHAAAQCSIGCNYAAGRGVSRNYAKARGWFLQAADQKNAKAQFNLGVIFLKGYGAQQNYAEAVIWFRKAADQGHVRAQAILGGLYIKGAGAPKDYTEAARWLQEAADRGHNEAWITLKLLRADPFGAAVTDHGETMVIRSLATEREVAADNRLQIPFDLQNRDDLTGVLTRSAFLNALQSEIDRIRSTETNAARGGLCVFFIEIDQSSQENGFADPANRYAILCGLADRLGANLRKSDIVGRIGRDEIAAGVTAVTLAGATALAERFRQAVAAEPFETPKGPLLATVNIGVAIFQESDSPASLLDRASAAKQAGSRQTQVGVRTR
jgi:diguanylate cyclase (GGDEF)-like protein